MSLSRHEAQPAIQVSDAVAVALEELEEERTALEQQRSLLSDQRVLLDLERKELEQQMQTLEFQYTLLDQLSTKLDQQEAMLASEVDQIRLTGMRSFPRRSILKAACNRRWRSKGNEARPYIACLMSLSFVICPSTCPLLSSRLRAASTAARSRSMRFSQTGASLEWN